jgi:hypothetical protein
MSDRIERLRPPPMDKEVILTTLTRVDKHCDLRVDL